MREHCTNTLLTTERSNHLSSHWRSRTVSKQLMSIATAFVCYSTTTWCPFHSSIHKYAYGNCSFVSVTVCKFQVAGLATYTFMTFCLVGRQFLIPEKHIPGHEVDYYIPVFTIIQFLFYVGWFKVNLHMHFVSRPQECFRWDEILCCRLALMMMMLS